MNKNLIFYRRKPASFFEGKQALLLQAVESIIAKIEKGEIVYLAKGYGGFTITTSDGRRIKKVEAVKLKFVE